MKLFSDCLQSLYFSERVISKFSTKSSERLVIFTRHLIRAKISVCIHLLKYKALIINPPIPVDLPIIIEPYLSPP